MPAAIRSARPPAVAGQFYDTDPRRLQAEIEQLLATAPRQDASVRPKAIIAPHAGYRYSGQVAATAMAALDRYTATIERVILIGPAHYVPFRGIAAPTVRAFATPLGLVPLDQDVLGRPPRAGQVRRRTARPRARPRGRAPVPAGPHGVRLRPCPFWWAMLRLRR